MRVNIYEKLVEEKHQSGEDVVQQVKSWLYELEVEAATNRNNFLEQLDASRLFNTEQIKKICIDYRLRFLDLKKFKGKIPDHALENLSETEQKLGMKLKELKIVAPAKMFELEDCNSDPLLLAKVSDDTYYLIDYWGRDLHALRKWMVWPLQSLQNGIITIFALSFVLALLVPRELLVTNASLNAWPYRIMFFAYLVMAISGMATFFGFMFYKNFTNVEWNRKSFN